MGTPKSMDLNRISKALEKLKLQRLIVTLEIIDGAPPGSLLVTHRVPAKDQAQLSDKDGLITDAVRPYLPEGWFFDGGDYGKARGRVPAYERTYIWMSPKERLKAPHS